jgi:hypothetical protein
MSWYMKSHVLTREEAEEMFPDRDKISMQYLDELREHLKTVPHEEKTLILIMAPEDVEMYKEEFGESVEIICQDSIYMEPEDVEMYKEEFGESVEIICQDSIYMEPEKLPPTIVFNQPITVEEMNYEIISEPEIIIRSNRPERASWTRGKTGGPIIGKSRNNRALVSKQYPYFHRGPRGRRG